MIRQHVSSWALIACGALVGLSSSVAAQPLAGERAATVTAIAGVISADATWELVWADFKTADGIVGTPDGGVLFAQEQGDTIRKLDANNRESIYLTDTHGAGALSIDAQGRLYAVQRACTDPGRPFSSACQELPRISILAPEQRLLANTFSDGRSLGRLNDLIADGKGGAYFTVGGIYYVNAQDPLRHERDDDCRI
jgi:sugar lactone lactonase YvrE